MIRNSENERSGYDYLIVGAGHQGLAMAAHFSLNGEKVKIWNRTRAHIEKVIDNKSVICDGIVKGTAIIESVSTTIEEVLTKTIYVTTPSTAYKDIAKMLAPILLPDTIIFLNPGRTFGAIEFMETLSECGCKNTPLIVETQSIVYTCRRTEKNEAFIFALKKNVEMSYIGSASDKETILERIPKCIRDAFVFVNSILDTSFGNIGMILHCAPVLMNIGWIESKHIFRYYYDGITPSIGRFLQKMDEERIAVARSVGIDSISLIEWFHNCYGVPGSSIYDCIQNNEYYKEIDAPQTINHRYIEEDVPNGLVPIEYIGKKKGVNVDHISLIIDLACEITGKNFREIGRQYDLNILNRYR